jgi:drug/metabolite transporter (DMT)-like permease
MDSVVVGVVLACLASCMFNAGIGFQAIEARALPRDLGLHLSLLGRLARRPRWLIGVGLNAVAVPTQTVALLFAPVTVVQPADAAGLLLLLFIGSRMLGERVGPRELGAVGAIVAGIVILTLVAPHREVTHADAADVLLPLAAVAVVALAPIALRSIVRPASILVVFGAGFAFALGAFGIKLVADALDRGEWVALPIALAAVVVGAAAGTLSEQTALQRRPATHVAPIIFVVELFVPLALAVIVVGEDWSGSTPAIVVALALVVVGVVALMRAPQVSSLLGGETREPGAPPRPATSPVSPERA